MIEEDDDEYYDDEEEDEEYEDEETKGTAAPSEGGGKGPLIFAVVAGLLAIVVVFGAIKFLTGGGDEPAEGAVTDLEGGATAAEPASGDSVAAASGGVELGSSFNFDELLGDSGAGASGSASSGSDSSGSSASGSGSSGSASSGSGSSGSTARAATASSTGSGSTSSGSGSSSSGSGSSSSGSTSKGSGSSTTGSASSGSGDGGYREGQIIEDSSSSSRSGSSRGGDTASGSGSGSSSSSAAVTKEEQTPAPAKKEEQTPAPAKKEEQTPAPAKEESAPEPAPATNLDYEKATMASLGSKAGGGTLSGGEIGHLQGIPADHPNYTIAWAALMANAESKRDYKGHCDSSDKIMEKPGNRYHPEYNLERAKCQMRNGDLTGAIDSVDRTVGNSYDMNPSSKTARLLLAYEIKARCRTKLFDDNAKANAGLGDEGKLNSALQAWSEYKNYASGIGNQSALQKAEREIADLEARKGG